MAIKWSRNRRWFHLALAKYSNTLMIGWLSHKPGLEKRWVEIDRKVILDWNRLTKRQFSSKSLCSKATVKSHCTAEILVISVKWLYKMASIHYVKITEMYKKRNEIQMAFFYYAFALCSIPFRSSSFRSINKEKRLVLNRDWRKGFAF